MVRQAHHVPLKSLIFHGGHPELVEGSIGFGT